jgi:hypothetical protein
VGARPEPSIRPRLRRTRDLLNTFSVANRTIVPRRPLLARVHPSSGNPALEPRRARPTPARRSRSHMSTPVLRRARFVITTLGCGTSCRPPSARTGSSAARRASLGCTTATATVGRRHGRRHDAHVSRRNSRTGQVSTRLADRRLCSRRSQASNLYTRRPP